jgi:hypothetical protein
VLGVGVDPEGHLRVLHRQPGELGADLGREPLGGGRAAGGHPLGERRELGARRVAGGGQRLQRLVGHVQLGQPVLGVGGPGQHPGQALTRVGVLAHQRGDLGPPVQHLGQPGRVGVEVGHVPRQLDGDVGDHGDGVGEVPGQQDQRGVVGAGQCPLGDGQGRGGVLRELPSPAQVAGHVADQREPGLVGCGAERVGVPEAGGLGIERLVLPRLGGDG